MKGSEKSTSAIAAKVSRKNNKSEKLLEVSSKSRLLHRLKLSRLKSDSNNNDNDTASNTNTKELDSEDPPLITPNIQPSAYVSDFVWRKAMFD